MTSLIWYIFWKWPPLKVLAKNLSIFPKYLSYIYIVGTSPNLNRVGKDWLLLYYCDLQSNVPRAEFLTLFTCTKRHVDLDQTFRLHWLNVTLAFANILCINTFFFITINIHLKKCPTLSKVSNISQDINSNVTMKKVLQILLEL
jgi:hypothetical protein